MASGTVIAARNYDEERALYHLTDAVVRDCSFAGPADGESVLKECRNITVENCRFSLRYPLWHAQNFLLTASELDEKTRAPIWYCTNGKIQDCRIDGVKCLRECLRISVTHSEIHSPEFGWKSAELSISDSEIESEYFLLDSRAVTLDRIRMKGKYSFQYMQDLTIRNSVLDTKDAFWHSKNVTVSDSVVKGEYLGWFSEGLTLINCEISGTQPLCYCKNLKLIHCTMHGADLAFEYSDVDADISGTIDSVKNPRSGKITADAIGEIIREDAVMDCCAEIVIRNA